MPAKKSPKPVPLALHVLPQLAPILQRVLGKIIAAIPEGTPDDEEVDVKLNGDDHQVLGLLQAALTEAQVARLRGER
jgi:hypothetical protein